MKNSRILGRESNFRKAIVFAKLNISVSRKSIFGIGVIAALFLGILTPTASIAGTGAGDITQERSGNVVTVTVDCSVENDGSAYIINAFRGDTVTLVSKTTDDTACNRITIRLFNLFHR